MQPQLVVLALFLIAVFVGLPIWMIVKILGHARDIEVLEIRLRTQENEMRDLRAMLSNLPATSLSARREPTPPPAQAAAPAPVVAPPPPKPPPEIPLALPQPAAAMPLFAAMRDPTPAKPLPPVLQETPVIFTAPAPRAPVPAKPKINWEQFMGAKLFAWLGGFALFLGVAFFVSTPSSTTSSRPRCAWRSASSSGSAWWSGA